jgi:hypothetical protein
MAKATLTTKSGATVVIEGDESEVHRLLTRIQTGDQSEEKLKPSRTDRKSDKRLPSATDAILGLKDEGFFDKPQGLSAIKDKLASQGMIYPVTTLSGVVLALIRRRALARVKEGSHWVYVAR